MLRREGMAGLARRVARRVRPSSGDSAEERWIRLHCDAVPSSNPLLSRRFRRALGGYTPVADYLAPFTGAATDRMLDRALHHDLRVYLPQLLHKEDRASMAVSIESRVPLLDYRLVELLATVPPEQKALGAQPKALLRRAAARWLPPEAVDRRDKVPFAVPVRQWLGTVLRPLVREVVQSPACLERGVFDPDLIRRGLLDDGELLALLNVELWHRIYIDRDPRWCAEIPRASGRAADPGARAVDVQRQAVSVA
jgi:asparagine synthase (glutamine-hydrolysing)